MPRKKNYRAADVVDRAMHAFWRDGYEATSIQQLVETTGINRFSMYQAFGDKRGLFDEVLRHYFDDVLARVTRVSESAHGGVNTIRLYFEALATTLTSSIGRLGCLGQNTGIELALRDPAAVEPLKKMYNRLYKNFKAALEVAGRRGEIPPDTSCADVARFLVTAAQGMIVMARTADDAHYIRSTARQVTRVLTSSKSDVILVGKREEHERHEHHHETDQEV